LRERQYEDWRKSPLGRGKKASAFRGGSCPSGTTHAYTPRGGESSSLLVVPIFMLCGADHAGMDGSSLIKMDLSKTLGEN